MRPSPGTWAVRLKPWDDFFRSVVWVPVCLFLHLVSPGDLVLLLLFPNSLSLLRGLYPHAVDQGPALLSSLSLIPNPSHPNRTNPFPFERITVAGVIRRQSGCVSGSPENCQRPCPPSAWLVALLGSTSFQGSGPGNIQLSRKMLPPLRITVSGFQLAARIHWACCKDIAARGKDRWSGKPVACAFTF